MLAPGEVTITTCNARHSAQYPLEQYGGDTGHTDARSEINAFGATPLSSLTKDPR